MDLVTYRQGRWYAYTATRAVSMAMQRRCGSTNHSHTCNQFQDFLEANPACNTLLFDEYALILSHAGHENYSYYIHGL